MSFRIGKYEDEVLCDVVPMQASHLLLGRPWQFDEKAKHDGFTNKYSFEHKQQPVTLVPLTPRQVYEDQLKLQSESDKRKESESMKNKEREAENYEKEKKKRELSENRKEERKANFYARASEVKRALFTKKPMIVLMYKEEFLNTNQLDSSLPSAVISLLQGFDDVFQEEVLARIPPIEGLSIK